LYIDILEKKKDILKKELGKLKVNDVPIQIDFLIDEKDSMQEIDNLKLNKEIAEIEIKIEKLNKCIERIKNN
jgi:D-mannonate dehydratase